MCVVGGSAVRGGGVQHDHRGEGQEGAGSHVPLGRRGGGEPRTLRLHQTQDHAHVCSHAQKYMALCNASSDTQG